MYPVKYTLGECKKRILKLLDRYSSNGNENIYGEVVDIKKRIVSSINMHLAKLMYEFEYAKKRCCVSFFRNECRFDYGSGFISDYGSFSKDVYAAGCGFHMVASGKGRLVLRSAGGEEHVFTIDTRSGEYTVIVGASREGAEGLYGFKLYAEPFLDIRSFTVYEGAFEQMGNTDLICEKGTVAAYMPSDCSRILSLTRQDEADGIDYSYAVETDAEAHIMTVTDKLCGRFVLEYIPFPTVFAEEAPDEAEMALSPVMYDALCYMCAADLCPGNDPELYSKLTYKYREILENMYNRHSGIRVVNKFYGIISGIPGMRLRKYGI